MACITNAQSTAISTQPSNTHFKKTDIHAADRLLADKCYPEYQWHAKNLIDGYLNFYPGEPVCLTYEPMLQTLIAGFKSGQIPETVFAKETEIICKKIRNECLGQFKDVHKLVYDETDFETYNSYLPHYKIAARERLCELLEWEPDIQDSLYAELFIRELMREDTYYTGMDSTPLDNLAINIIWYRWALRKNGSVEEAEDSALYGDALSRMWGETAYYFLRKK